jgi:hypothetical protein
MKKLGASQAAHATAAATKLVYPKVDVARPAASMSAYGPKRTWSLAPHMSALGGKADMPCCTA